MEHHKLVLPEHLNNHGSLFGGYLLKWLDEYAYITACLEFPDCKFVTIGLDDVTFAHAIECGQVLCFQVNRKRLGNTSVTYTVDVVDGGALESEPRVFFATTITFVNVDENGARAISKST